MAGKRRIDDDHFLGTHFASKGELSVNDSIRGAGQDTLKAVLLEHLLEGETVTRALKRLRPTPKQVGTKKRRQIGGSQRQRTAAAALEADAFFSELEGNVEEKAKEEERKKRAFNQVTEAASELMELGYEDIYTDTREAIQASSRGRPPGAQRKSMYVWHDDGMSAPRKRDVENDITSFKDLPRPYESGGSRGPAHESSCQDAGRQPGGAQGAPAASSTGNFKEEAASSAAATAGGSVSYQTAVPFQYPEQPAKQAPRPAVPKMAPLPPPPGGFRPQAPAAQPVHVQHPASQPQQHPQHNYAHAPPAHGYAPYPAPPQGDYSGQYMQPWQQQQWQYHTGQTQQPPAGGQYPPYHQSAPSAWPT